MPSIQNNDSSKNIKKDKFAQKLFQILINKLRNTVYCASLARKYILPLGRALNKNETVINFSVGYKQKWKENDYYKVMKKEYSSAYGGPSLKVEP